MIQNNNYPQRVVCLAAEAPEILDALGALDRVVGRSAFASPRDKIKQIPNVGGFATPNIEKILALQPDLIITTSDIQAKIAAQLIGKGLPVLALTPHRLADVWRNILLIGGAMGLSNRAEKLVTQLRAELTVIRDNAPLVQPVRVYFEEWPDPLISGIGWVSDLIEYLGGEDVFAELRSKRLAMERVILPESIIAQQPELIILSWCGKPAKIDDVIQRSGWQDIPAVQNGYIYEIESNHILQTGPGMLEGARQLKALMSTWKPAKES